MGKIQISNVPFRGTEEQAKELHARLEKLKGVGGALMPALQEAQDVYGYLPIEVQQMVADFFGISMEEVFGVSTFYAQFALNPKGKYAMAVCLGTACYVKGSGDVMDRLSKELGLSDGATSADGKYSLASTRCIGCCGLAPVMTVNGDVYGKLVPDDIPKIIAKYQ